mgnify:FL=1
MADATVKNLEAFREQVRSCRALRHQFFDLLADESDVERGRSLIREWARSDYWVSREFPALVATLAGETQDLDVRIIFVRNLWDEFGHGKLNAAHFALYRKFLDSIDEPEPTEPSESARAFLKFQEDLAFQNPALAAGVFCYANEYMCQFEFAQLTRDVHRIFDGSDTRYFSQLQVDVRHAEELEGALRMFEAADLPGFDKSLHDALGTVLELRALHYDRVVEAVLGS